MVRQSQTFTQMISENMRLNTPEKLENLMKTLLGKLEYASCGGTSSPHDYLYTVYMNI